MAGRRGGLAVKLRPQDRSRIFRPIIAAIWPSRLTLRTGPKPGRLAAAASNHRRGVFNTPVTEPGCVHTHTHTFLNASMMRGYTRVSSFPLNYLPARRQLHHKHTHTHVNIIPPVFPGFCPTHTHTRRIRTKGESRGTDLQGEYNG